MEGYYIYIPVSYCAHKMLSFVFLLVISCKLFLSNYCDSILIDLWSSSDLFSSNLLVSSRCFLTFLFVISALVKLVWKFECLEHSMETSRYIFFDFMCALCIWTLCLWLMIIFCVLVLDNFGFVPLIFVILISSISVWELV